MAHRNFLPVAPPLLARRPRFVLILGESRASALDGMCVWKIVGFSGCRRKPTSPCPFSSERPVLGSSQRDGTSAADAMVEKIQFQKSSTFCEKSFMHRHFPATSWLPTAPSCTPNNPPCTPGAPWVDSDRRRWDSAFFGFPPFPPTRTPHPTTPYTLRTLDHRPDSESQPQPLFFHLARKTPRFWYTLKSGPVGGRDSAVAHAVQDTGP